jgi:thiamine biosynthesis lipoprotein
MPEVFSTEDNGSAASKQRERIKSYMKQICTIIVFVVLGAMPDGRGSIVAAEPALARYRYEQVHMGMPVELILYVADEQTANLAAEAVYARFAELNRVLSDYDPASELSQLSSKSGTGQAVPAGDDLWRVITAAVELAAATDGAFDPSIGPLTRLWRRSKRQRELPSPALLAEARAAVDYRAIRLDLVRHTIALERPNMRLDLGGIAAGFAVDESLKILRQRGITRAMVDASGDIGVGDPPPGAAGWRIGVSRLDGNDERPLRYVLLANAAVTTSGDAFQFVEIAGVRYSHIVDPSTGLGLTERRSVSVIARDCISADSLATAVCVMGAERGLKFLATRPGTAAIFATQDNGELKTAESPTFAKFVAQ